MLEMIGAHKASEQLIKIISEVKSGDSTQMEAHAARLYWPYLFGENFVRERKGSPPNHLLNYGYTILRAATARALVGRGLLPSCSIQHHNRYNAYPLADDMMEPYRPFVDQVVWEIHKEQPSHDCPISHEDKARLFASLQSKCIWKARQTTLSTALDRSAEQLFYAFDSGKVARTLFATFPTK